MSETPELGLPLPADGQNPWGADYREAMTLIDNATVLLKGVRATSRLLDNEVATEIVQANAYVKARLPGAVNQSFAGQIQFPQENRMLYTGGLARTPVVTISVALSTTGTDQDVRFALAKNSIVDESVAMTVRGLSDSAGSATAVGVVNMATDDYLEVWVQNITSANDVVIHDLNMLVRG